MDPEFPTEAEVEGWLSTLGVRSLCQCDLLLFLYRHQTSLVGADHLARLLGYAGERIMAALDELESAGLVERSRVSQGARLYQFTVPAPERRRKCFEQLMALAGHRAGRLFLSKKLTNDGGREQKPASPWSLLKAGRWAQAAGNRPCQPAAGRKSWPKAI